MTRVCSWDGCSEPRIKGFSYCSHHQYLSRKEYYIKRRNHPKRLTNASWRCMVQRCTNPLHKSYKNYGAKGIRVCDRWLGKDGYANFVKDMGLRPAGKTLDRIDYNGNYCPENCRWADIYTQSTNKSSNTDHIGIYQRKSKSRHWCARLTVNGRHYSKTLPTREEAEEQYQEWVKKYRKTS